MKGYTIENSIDLLEKDVKALKEGGGGGGASTWNQLQGKPFSELGEELYNLDGALTVNVISADKIALPDSTEYSWDYLPQAIEALAEDSNHFSDDISELEEKTDQLFTSVSNGKTLVASAITDKGVETLATDTFQTMADNIRAIETSGSVETGFKLAPNASGVLGVVFNPILIQNDITFTYTLSNIAGFEGFAFPFVIKQEASDITYRLSCTVRHTSARTSNTQYINYWGLAIASNANVNVLINNDEAMFPNANITKECYVDVVVPSGSGSFARNLIFSLGAVGGTGTWTINNLKIARL